MREGNKQKITGRTADPGKFWDRLSNTEHTWRKSHSFLSWKINSGHFKLEKIFSQSKNGEYSHSLMFNRLNCVFLNKIIKNKDNLSIHDGTFIHSQSEVTNE